MRVGLNLLHVLPEIGGVWNYIENLLALIGREDHDNEYVAYATAVSAPLVPRSANFRLVLMPIRSRSRVRRVLFEHTALQVVACRHHLSCMHWFANVQGIINAAPAVVTVYDLLPFVDGGSLSKAKRTYLRWRMRETVGRAAMLLPMSHTTANGLHSVLGADPERMTVIPPILEPAFTRPDDPVVVTFRMRYRLPSEFWLYVAHMYPHKNHLRLLRAYRALKSRNPLAWPLVFRGDDQGMMSPIKETVSELELAEDVILLPRLERNELPALYGAASALVFPSLHEGAGIPVLEAQACGCPVVAADIAAIREFAADSAEYFDPLHESEIELAMMRVGGDRALREDLRQRGLDRAARFRGTATLGLLLKAYKQAGRSGSGAVRGPRP